MDNFISALMWCLSLSLFSLTNVRASVGDRTAYYQKCVDRCSDTNCTGDGQAFVSKIVQPLYLQLTVWTCKDECRYECMWDTVDSFIRRSWDIPQFHGKWPFIRLFGLQEPASVLFSLMNLAAHFVMLKQFRKEVRRTSPLYWLWHAYAIVCLNAWVWSSVFHARDIAFTEKMDYFCAFSMVLFSFYSMVIRFLGGKLNFISFLFTMLCLGFFTHHVTYLSMVKFDYGYNMMANIIVAVANSLGWLVWCWWTRGQQPYVWRCALYVAVAGLGTLFEVADFPPFLWVVDAHSLWHLSTAALPFIFYRFLIDDCKHLGKLKQLNEDKFHKH